MVAVGWLSLLGSITGFSCLYLFTKFGGRKGAETTNIAIAIYAFGAVITAIFVFARPGTAVFSGYLPYLAVLFGVSGSLGFLFFVKALESGHYGFTTALLQVSSLFGAVFSVLFYNEPFGILEFAGIACIFAGIFLINFFGLSLKSEAKSAWVKWIVLVSLCIVLNGIATITQLVAAKTEGSDFFSFLLVFYIVGAICLTLTNVKKIKFGRAELIFGSSAAVSSMFGNLLSLVTLSILPGVIVFPISPGGLIIANTLLSLFVFKEKISLTGYMGISACAVGIMVLSV